MNDPPMPGKKKHATLNITKVIVNLSLKKITNEKYISHTF